MKTETKVFECWQLLGGRPVRVPFWSVAYRHDNGHGWGPWQETSRRYPTQIAAKRAARVITITRSAGGE